MAMADESEHADGIIALVKETASGLGQLVGDHIRLARIEMTADAKTYVRDASMLVVGGFILAAGYGLACIAAGLGLARIIGGPLAFASLAVLHLVVGGIALVSMLRKMKQVQLMHETKQEVTRSVSALARRDVYARSH
jgi:uncharacterized membrane protein YqjE